jgi:hypothetical protein
MDGRGGDLLIRTQAGAIWQACLGFGLQPWTQTLPCPGIILERVGIDVPRQRTPVR